MTRTLKAHDKGSIIYHRQKLAKRARPTYCKLCKKLVRWQTQGYRDGAPTGRYVTGPVDNPTEHTCRKPDIDGIIELGPMQGPVAPAGRLGLPFDMLMPVWKVTRKGEGEADAERAAENRGDDAPVAGQPAR